MDNNNEKWNEVLQLVKKEMLPTGFDTWIKPLVLKSIDTEKGTIDLITYSEMSKSILANRYTPLLQKAIYEIYGQEFTVNLLISEDVNSSDKESTAKEQEYYEKVMQRPGNDELQLNPKYNFSTFVVGASNELAYAASFAVAKSPATTYNPLFLYGSSGTGKTHLMKAIANRVKEKNPDANVIFVKGEIFTNELIKNITKKTTAKFKEKYRNADMLLIDDVQFIAGKVSTQEEFFHTFNALYDAHKQIILTSDRPPRDIQHLEDRILTRFEGGLIVDIQPPDTELRIAIAKSKAEIMNVRLSNDVLTFIGENIKSNVRQIEGAIKKLGAYGFVNQTPITVDMVKNLLSAVIDNAESPELMADKIIENISKRYDISVEDIKGKKRTKEIVSARHIAVYVVREVTGMSFPNIAKLFNRDHTTMLSSIDVVEEEMSKNSAYEHEIDSIIKEFKS